jgi:hypothetical protein
MAMAVMARLFMLVIDLAIFSILDSRRSQKWTLPTGEEARKEALTGFFSFVQLTVIWAALQLTKAENVLLNLF